MFVEELNPSYVPVNIRLTKEEKDSVQMAIDIIAMILDKEIDIYNCYEEELTYKLEEAIEALEGVRDGFPDMELRLYK